MFERAFAKTISYLFHPLLMPSLGLALLVYSNPYLAFVMQPAVLNALFTVVFISTFVFPVLSSLLLLFTGRIKSLEMQTGEERRLPYLLTAVFYTIGYYMISSKITLPQEISLMILGANLSVVLTMLINMVRKISAHAVAIGGLIGAFMGADLTLYTGMANELMLLFLIAGIIGYARLKLNAHKPLEVYSGYLLGFTSEFLLFLFFSV